MITIVEDSNKILLIIFEDKSLIKVGFDGVEKIEPYQECGEMAYVTWFTIWVNGKIDRRVNGKYVACIKYQEGVK